MINEQNLLKSSVLWSRTLFQGQGQQIGTQGWGQWLGTKDEDKDIALCSRGASKMRTIKSLRMHHCFFAHLLFHPLALSPPGFFAPWLIHLLCLADLPPGMDSARGEGAALPCALYHAKMWLIKCHFCKTTQMSVSFLHSQIQKAGKFVAFVAGGLCPPDSLMRGSAPGPHYIFSMLTKDYCPPCVLALNLPPSPLLPSSFKFLSSPMTPGLIDVPLADLPSHLGRFTLWAVCFLVCLLPGWFGPHLVCNNCG